MATATRSPFGNRHTEACASTDCPCYRADRPSFVSRVVSGVIGSLIVWVPLFAFGVLRWNF